MITGAHAIIFSTEAEQARAFLHDVLGLDSVDAGGGWLIFALPPAELAVHPTETETETEHELYLMCDDVHATVAELTAKGAQFTRRPIDSRDQSAAPPSRRPVATVSRRIPRRRYLRVSVRSRELNQVGQSIRRQSMARPDARACLSAWHVGYVGPGKGRSGLRRRRRTRGTGP